jgi:hypothetical protein
MIKNSELPSFYDEYNYLAAQYALQIDGYKWLHPSEWIAPQIWPTKEGDRYNPFVVDSQEDRTVLGKDILQKGMYFPLYVTNGNVIKLGFHRGISLQLVDTDKKFLCISIPDVSSAPLPKPFFWAKTYEEAFILIKAMPGNMREAIYELKIPPFYAYQTEEAWEEYLGSLKPNEKYDYEGIHKGMLRDIANKKKEVL